MFRRARPVVAGGLLWLCAPSLVACSGSIGGDPLEGDVDAAVDEASADAATPETSAAETSAPDAVVDDTARDVAPPVDVACTKMRDKCATASECCPGNACLVTPLPGGDPSDTRCCRAESSPCAEHDDCCGYLLCSGGKCVRRGVDGACGADSDCTTNECTAGRCVDPTAVTGYRLPLACGGPYTVSQGNFDTKCTVYSHTDVSKYAYDFAVGLNTPVLAMRGGDVTHVKNDIKPGNPCYSGGGSSCINSANYVTIKHADGYSTVYVHLNDALVTVGQKVVQGQKIGLSGGTGWSTGPHMHVQKQVVCPYFYCQSVPLIFDEYPTRLDCGLKVSSKNGC